MNVALPLFEDEAAPSVLSLIIEDPYNKKEIWAELELAGKIFSTGSCGFYAGGKISNPENPDMFYQVSCNMVLIGSKPDA